MNQEETIDTCILDRCRPGIRTALVGIVERVRAGRPTTAVVIAPRYGKSNLMRQAAIELLERQICGVALILTPWIFLRGQMNDRSKIDDMVRQHGIDNGAKRSPKIITPDILFGKIDPRFCQMQPRRHWWTLTMAQAMSAETLAILTDLAAQCREDLRPMVVFIDECQYTSNSTEGWGEIAKALKEAGAILVLLTGTPERADNLLPFGFTTVEIERDEIRYAVRKVAEQLIEIREADKVRYRLQSDVPEVGLQQAWKEHALAKLDCRTFTFKCDGVGISELQNKEVRRALGKAVRDPETIRTGVRLMLNELRIRRETDGLHGAANPETAAIVFVGNDKQDDNGNDWHAREVQRLIKQEWKEFFPNKAPQIRIVTMNVTNDEADKAARMIKDFVDGDGDILVVKQMGSVGLDGPRIKVGLDFSTVRSKSATTQRWLRIATPTANVSHGTMIRPDDPITNALWEDIVTEQGGQYAIENVRVVDEKPLEPSPDGPKPPPVISDAERSFSVDNSLREVETDLDRQLDAIIARSPLFAIRFTRRELADEFEKGTFTLSAIAPGTTTNGAAAVFEATDEVRKRQDHCNRLCKELASRETFYTGGSDPEQDEKWIRVIQRWMSKTKAHAGIQGHLRQCLDIDKLDSAIAYLESCR